jgi:hypothetical protein
VKRKYKVVMEFVEDVVYPRGTGKIGMEQATRMDIEKRWSDELNVDIKVLSIKLSSK